ncbi:allergen Api m 6-like [Spodoptera litura]|uniref:Allergen Api m 6-like n=1 Tax=Spodoptera litura TaxID=69820 RepID=A0A9J7E8H6_SPOLT|nr:allergen Api m 6-like [Spodoptera litura]
MASSMLSICLLVAVLTVVSSAPADEKPLDCPEGEYYIKCSQAECFQKCDHLVNLPACPSLLPSCYSPACLCDNGNLRNSEGKCVPKEQCDRANSN